VRPLVALGALPRCSSEFSFDIKALKQLQGYNVKSAQIAHSCHSERSEESLIISGPKQSEMFRSAQHDNTFYEMLPDVSLQNHEDVSCYARDHADRSGQSRLNLRQYPKQNAV
jgi:hypothetical protein